MNDKPIHEQLAEIGKSYPNARDCEHGRQRGKCDYCDYVEIIVELGSEIERLREWQRIANQRAVEVADLKIALREARRQAFEEAAQICDARAARGQDEPSLYEIACEDCANAIRDHAVRATIEKGTET